MRIKHVLLLALVSILGLLSYPASLSAQEYQVIHNQHWVTTWDGYKLDVDVYSPNFDINLPLVIFSPSWGVGKIEYMIPAMLLAKRGYIVASYTARGWFQSTGVINVGEENDMRDISTIIDFVLAHYPADRDNIGMSGISMGGERSLTIPLYESRIKAIAALSCTANYQQNLYKQNTPNNAHALSGGPTIFADAINDLINGTNVGNVIQWADSLSPATYLDKYNQLKQPPAMYIANAYDDVLMDNNSLLDFFSQLDIPNKVIDLNIGKHAFPVGIGCVGLPERTWTKVYKWFDYYLKGISSDIIERVHSTKVGLQLKGTSERLYFHVWPSKKIRYQPLYLHPRQDYSANASNRKSSMNVYSYKSNAIDTIQSGTGSAANLAPFDDLSELILVPVTTNINQLNPKFAMIYETIPFSCESIMAGIPVLDLSVTPNKPDAQIIAYLYDVNVFGYGTLLTHSAWTLRDVEPGIRQHLRFEFNVVACRILEHHKLALVLDTYDKRFGFPERPAYSVNIHYDDKPVLKVPYTYEKPVYEPVQ